MTKSIFNLVFLFITGLQLSAQNFDITYTGNQTPYFWAEVAQTTDNGFVFATTGTNSFIKVDATGQVEWEFNELFSGSVPRSDGGGVVAMTDGSVIIGGELSNNTGYLTRLSNDGQIIWDRVVIGGDIQGISLGENGDIFVLKGCCSGSIQVCRYNDSNGNTFWCEYFHSIQGINGLSDGGVAVSGNISGNLTLKKYDLEQNEIWSYTGPAGPFNNSNNLFGITETPNGNIYAVGNITNNSSGFNTNYPFMVVLDESGNVINEITFQGSGFFQSISKTGDGNLLVAGLKGITYTAKIDYAGNIIWERFSDGNRISDVHSTTDGGSISLVRNGNGESRLIKTDENGIVFNTFIQGSHYLDQNDDCEFQTTDSLLSTLTLATNNTTNNVYYAQTNASGIYTIDCPLGQYSITANLPSENEPCESTTVSMTANIQYFQAEEKIYQFNPNPTSILEGLVYIDNNTNCEFDAGDTPLECIRPAFVQEGQFEPIFYGESDANGFFQIEVPADEYYFIINFSSSIYGNSFADGCFLPGDYVNAYDTTFMNLPLEPIHQSPAYISGYLYIDENLDCEINDIEITTNNFDIGIRAFGTSDTLQISPHVDGYFAQIVEAGTYELFILFDGNDNWIPCENIFTVDANSTCIDEINLGIQPVVPCSDFSVSIATNRFRPCLESQLIVNYQNIGTASATPQITVILDTLLVYNSSEISPAVIVGDTLYFDIPEVQALASGSFKIFTTLDCEAVNGETHCISATISSDNDCQDISQSWDGSSIQINGFCEAGVLDITIENIGDEPMTEALEYIVIEDNILLSVNPFQLDTGELINFQLTPEGASIFIESGQAENHPGRSMPARSFEGCGENTDGNFSLGFITQYPQDDANEDVSIFCLENVNSYDPNDKQGFPRGITDGNFIENTTQLEYMIRFQNTGNAPAKSITIKDEISEHLDFSTLRPGASSHYYTFSVEANNTASFLFPGIFLPDSTSDVEASQGFITFTIDQKENNPLGTEIFNKANIFFDNNPAIQTNTTVHRIPFPVLESNFEMDFCENDIYLGINLTQDTTIIQTIEFPFFDSTYSHELTVFENYEVTLDTTILAGDYYNGIQYFEPTTIIDSLHSVNGCDSIVTLTLDVLVDTENQQKEAISIFPNPSYHSFNIFNIPANIRTIDITNSLGEKITTRKIDHKSSNIIIYSENWSAGIYFVNFQTPEHQYVRKITKF